MSRSSLIREAKRREGRERALEAELRAAGVSSERELYELNRNVRPGELPIHGNATTFNMNEMLLDLIFESEYFESLRGAATFDDIADAVQRHCRHAEPWARGAGREPSSLFCILVKAFTLRLTENEVGRLLASNASPWFCCLGMLYLRYTAPPGDLWSWFEPLLQDDRSFRPSEAQSSETTIGAYARRLLTDMRYFGTMLPRIPLKYERRIKMLLLLRKQRAQREERHRPLLSSLTEGAAARAIYADGETDPQWHDVEILRVIPSAENGTGLDADSSTRSPPSGAEDGAPPHSSAKSRNNDIGAENNAPPRFSVRFTEYGNVEELPLSEVTLPGHEDGVDRGGRAPGGAAEPIDEAERERRERLRDAQFFEDRGYMRRSKKRRRDAGEGEEAQRRETSAARREKRSALDLTQSLLKQIMREERSSAAAGRRRL